MAAAVVLFVIVGIFVILDHLGRWLDKHDPDGGPE